MVFGLMPEGVLWFAHNTHFCPRDGWFASITPSAGTGVVHAESMYDICA